MSEHRTEVQTLVGPLLILVRAHCSLGHNVRTLTLQNSSWPWEWGACIGQSPERSLATAGGISSRWGMCHVRAGSQTRKEACPINDMYHIHHIPSLTHNRRTIGCFNPSPMKRVKAPNIATYTAPKWAKISISIPNSLLITELNSNCS